MFTVLNVVSPIFAIVALGYLTVRFKFYPASGVKGLISFVNNFATPCLLFRAMLSVDFEESFSLKIVSPFFIAAWIVFVVGIIVARVWFKNRPGESIASGVAAMFSNLVLLGVPVMQRAYGDQAMTTMFSILGVHAAILLTTGMLTMEFVRRDRGRPLAAIVTTVKRVGSNPLLLGIGLGLIANLANITLAEPVDAFTLMMTQAIVPVALFGIGGALNEYKLANNWQQALVMSIFKLVLHPFLVWAIMVPILNVDISIARYVIVMSAMPSGINIYIFATQYKRSEDLAANTILITTVLSVFTITGWLLFLGG